MGAPLGAQIDNWIRDGGVVVTASERTARALQLAYHQRRRSEGLFAWPAPAIQAWTSFALAAWESQTNGDRMLLNPAQEQLLWAEIVAREQHLATALEAPRQRMAAMAIEAHERLCFYASTYLEKKARIAWDLDAGAFSVWLSAFDEACQKGSLLSQSRAPLEAIHALHQDATGRPQLLAVGFDRVLPIQRALFDAWGSWNEVAADTPAAKVHFFSAPDEDAELSACARWCRAHLAANPGARLLVISQEISARRGELERAFLHETQPDSKPLFEFSLGVTLSRIPLAHAANLFLRWLDGPLAEHELDWLFSTGLLTADSAESTALQAYMRALRRRGLARPEWTLQAFTGQQSASAQLPAAWLRRMHQTRPLLSARSNRRHTALEWAALVPELLSAAGIPGEHSLSSAEFQAWRRWSQALDMCGSLGFDGRRIAWPEFLASLARILVDTLFAPESSDAPIQIAGPAESAGLTADAIWFLGADEDAWPSSGSAHPLLPRYLQRETGMPHASPRHDWDLAQSITKRILHSAPRVHFSYAARKRDADARASRLIAQLAPPTQLLPAYFAPTRAAESRTTSFADLSRIPFAAERIRGGSAILTAQSQCPFKAFARARLGAESWESAEFGLSAAQRGLLLHAVLHAIWGGPPAGLRSLDNLLACADVNAFVAGHVRSVFEEKLPDGIRDRMPRRYLELEATRLTHVVAEWLAFEATRLPFTVADTESTRAVDIAGLLLDLRIDRIDRLNDDSLLVIDYKTGDVTPNAWQLPRPDDVQLPLYAEFGLSEPSGGLVFAKVRAGNYELAGHVRDARATLLNTLTGSSSLVKKTLTDEQLAEWKDYIEQLAHDFVAGHADVDPREYPATCQRCDLQALCRVYENHPQLESEDEVEEPANA
jgi:ATP-dependent helicase/nuclease subunit B